MHMPKTPVRRRPPSPQFAFSDYQWFAGLKNGFFLRALRTVRTAYFLVEAFLEKLVTFLLIFSNDIFWSTAVHARLLQAEGPEGALPRYGRIKLLLTHERVSCLRVCGAVEFLERENWSFPFTIPPLFLLFPSFFEGLPGSQLEYTFAVNPGLHSVFLRPL